MYFNRTMPSRLFVAAPGYVTSCHDAGVNFADQRYTILMNTIPANVPLWSPLYVGWTAIFVCTEQGAGRMIRIRSLAGVHFGRYVAWLDLPEAVRESCLHFYEEKERIFQEGRR